MLSIMTAQLKESGTRPQASRALIFKADVLRIATQDLSSFINNMPSYDAWDIILERIPQIKKYLSELEDIVQQEHHSRPAPDWVRNWNQMDTSSAK